MDADRWKRDDLAGCFRDAIVGVQRQTAVLMVAVNTDDRDLALIACQRIRAALREAELIETMLGGDATARAALHAARETATPWLYRAPKVAQIGDAHRLRERFGVRTLPSAPSDELIDLDLDGVDLSRVDMSGSRCIGVTARSARFVDTLANGVRWEWCELPISTMTGVRLDGAVLLDCRFDRANLERSSWVRVVATRVSLHGCAMADAKLDGATFTDCDLRGVDFGIVNGFNASPARTLFTRCDLRDVNWDARDVSGMQFVGCKLHGARGVPIGGDRTEIEPQDPSYAAGGPNGDPPWRR